MADELDRAALPHRHLKKWGKEYWIQNDKEVGYCMKHIICDSDMWSSDGKFHYHKKKDETFFVILGELCLDVEVDGVIRQLILPEYSHFRVKPGVKHRFKSSGTICHFVEASTFHSDGDSYRCYYDHTTRQWVDV